MRDTGPITYRDAGVDRDTARRAKDRILELLESTRTADVVPNPGGFGGLLRVPLDVERPLLVSSADGVGTKLKVAMLAGRHDTVGHDLVNHCVNDILVEGARPLMFLDYVGMGKLEAGVVEQLVAGVAAGCRENGCALVGGETAEMPDFYAPGEYDLAGFIVGVVSETARPGAHNVREGDVLLGLASNGFHTNGYTLVRRIVFDRLGLSPESEFPGTGRTVADELLRVHRSYLKPVHPLIVDGSIHALAHITGGGIPENLDRVIPDGLQARVEKAAWTPGPEFLAMKEASGADDDELYRTFNMGVGLVLVVAADNADAVVRRLEQSGEVVHPIGQIVRGDEKVVLA